MILFKTINNLSYSFKFVENDICDTYNYLSPYTAVFLHLYVWFNICFTFAILTFFEFLYEGKLTII